jgi:large subunit ribosomal protein L30
VTDKTKKTLQIKLVRSGIAFSHRQKENLRSLGLGKLNRVVERPDTPQIRGLVAAVPRLVEVVEKPASPTWMEVAEYSIKPPEVTLPPASEVEAPATAAATEMKMQESPAAVAESPGATENPAAPAIPAEPEASAPPESQPPDQSA